MTLFVVLFVFGIIIFLIVRLTREDAEPSRATSPCTEMDTVPPLQERRHFFTQLHGIFHKNPGGTSRQAIIRKCHVGEELRLVREPDNPRDRYAIKVCRINGDQLGYVSAEQAQRFCSDMDSGWTYQVSIDEIYSIEDRPRSRGVRLRVAVLTMSRGYEAARKAAKKG